MSKDWPSDAAAAIERVAETARDRTVRPAQAVTKAIVYGLLVAFFAASALVLVAIVIFRALTYAMAVWAAWLVLGGIFAAGGGFCWTKRSPSSK